MRLHVVFNENGEIVAAARLSGDAPVRARPVADEQAGHRAAETIVPAEYRHYDLAAVCQRLRVDASGTFPDLKARD